MVMTSHALIRLLLSFFLLLALGAAHAQMKGKPGGKDHPLVSRYEGSVLNNFGTTSFEQVDLPLARYESTTGPAKPSKSLRVEGKVMKVAAPNTASSTISKGWSNIASMKSGFHP